MGLPGEGHVGRSSRGESPGFGWYVWGRKRLTRAAAAVTVALLPLALATVFATSAQASTRPRTVTSLVTTEIEGAGTLPSGLTLSIVHVCPPGSSLDRARTADQIHRLPPNVRLISRELWPRGAVTRWRVTRAATAGSIVGSIQQTVACREPLRSTAGRHDAGVSVKVRVWGPVTGKVILDSRTTVGAFWGNARVGADLEVVRLVAPPRSFADVNLSPRDQASASAALLEHLRAGQFAELRLDLQVRSHLPLTAAQQITTTLREIAATPSRPVYFLGAAFAGLPITQVGQSAFHTVTFVVYGSCHPPPGPDSSCEPPLQVVTSEIGAAQLTRVQGCRRVTSVRGVPTVNFGGNLGVFTGHVLVQVFASGAGQLALEGRALGALRSVGLGAPSNRPLPPPDARLRVLIDRACGAAPRA